jgi:hypothetical protein
MGAQVGPGPRAGRNPFPAEVGFGVVAPHGLENSASSSSQIGAFGDIILTRRFSASPGLQRISIGGLTSGWMVGDGTALPVWQQTVTPGSVAGGQRMAVKFNPSALTPWTASQMRGQLVRAQIAQSGLAQAAFTSALIDANLKSA